jgi:subtilisin family serine protease
MMPRRPILDRPSVFAAVTMVLLSAPGAGTRAQAPERIVARWLEAPGPIEIVEVDGREAAAGEVLVKLRQPTNARVRDLSERHGVRSLRTVGRGDVLRMRSPSQSVEDLMAALSLQPDVEFVEPNYVLHLESVRRDVTPSDPFFGEQWGLASTGQRVDNRLTLPDADIDADLAWEITTGSPSIVVGVIDSGIDWTHPDLAANVWAAPGAFSVAVGGGFVDCPAGSHGYNAILNNCTPMDDDGHGTQVAGPIGAVGDNGVGIAGINWTTRLMALKIFDDQGVATTGDAIDAIEFAVQAKERFSFGTGADVRVLNASWGGSHFSFALRNEIRRATDAGILFVAGAGNSSADNDVFPHYPSGFDVPGLLSVAATGITDRIETFSNFGQNTVDLGAPGKLIYSTTSNGGAHGYDYAEGTSFAAPHVSGAAALVLSVCDLGPGELVELLIATVDPISTHRGASVSGGRLNVAHALDLCVPQLPTFTLLASPEDLTVSAGEVAEIQIDVRSWFGFDNEVTLSVGPIPGTFAPATLPGGGTSTLSLPGYLAWDGPNVVTITATSGGIVRTRDIRFRILGTAPDPVPLACGTLVAGALTWDDPSDPRSGTQRFMDRYTFELTTSGEFHLLAESPDGIELRTRLVGWSGSRQGGSGVTGGTSYLWTRAPSAVPGTFTLELASEDIGDYTLRITCPGDPPGRTDLVIDFGETYGVWALMNDAAWVQLHHISPEDIVIGDLTGTGKHDAIMDFGPPYGIWSWRDDRAWVQIHAASPEHMAAGDFTFNGQDDLIVDFGPPYGIWHWLQNDSWLQGHQDSAENILVANLSDDPEAEILIDFGPAYGVWIDPRSGQWRQVHQTTPEGMVTGDLDGDGFREIVVDFGPPYGIYVARNETTWTQLHGETASTMATGDVDGNGQDDVIIDFGDPYGIWIWLDNTSWVPLHWYSPETRMVTGDLDGNGQDEVIIDFGPPHGIWAWKNNAAWTQLITVSPEKMVTGNLDGF